ncbi:hypothetical protein JCM10449v2_000428 [Rhodotorula kratochvilovae]
MNQPISDAERSAMRFTAREKNKPRTDKAQCAPQAGRLHGRRENREIEELTAQCAALGKQLDDARDEIERMRKAAEMGTGKKSDKAVQKEMDALAKKIRRLEEERDAALAAKDALAAKLAALESSLAGDARFTKLTSELDAERTRAATLASKLKMKEEESATFQRRLEQLEKGGETAAEMQMNRQKKEYNEKVSRLEEKVARLEEDKVNLAGQVKTSKLKQDQLEELKAAFERDNARLTKQAQDADALTKRSEKALADARVMAQARSGGCSAEEKARLTSKIASLEILCSTLEAEVAGGSSGALDANSAALVRRYHDLVANLRLSDDDVSTLLSEGADWPPIRAQMPSSSLVDLLWLLTDQQDEREEDVRALEEKLARAKDDADKQKKRADAAIAAGHRAIQGDSYEAVARAAELDWERDRLERDRDRLERERDRLESDARGARDDKARDRETIVQLEARISAFEANASRQDRSPSRASSSFAAPTATSGYSQAVVDRLTKTITDLNQQVSELRDENTTLLLQLAGDGPAFDKVDRNKPRIDKAFLLNAGRLMERRDNRELDGANARIASLEAELAEVRKKGAVDAAMGSTSGGAVKVLQKEVCELRDKLSALQQHTSCTASEEGSAGPDGTARSSSGSSSGDDGDPSTAQARVHDLETHVKALLEVIDTQEGQFDRLELLCARSVGKSGATACGTCGELEGAVERLKGRVEALGEENTKLSAQVKLARAQHKQGDADAVLKLERLTARLAQADKRVEALEAETAAARTAARSKSKEMERALREKDGVCEKAVREWRSRYDRAKSAAEVAAESSTRRYADLLTNLRLTAHDVTTLLAEGPDWPPIRAQLRDLSLLDLLWVLTDKEDEQAEQTRVLNDKLARLEGEATKSKKSGADQLKQEKARCQKTIDELKARVEAFEASASRHARMPSQVSTKAPGSSDILGCSPAVVDRLTKRIAELNDQVSELRDENSARRPSAVALLLKLAGADD